MWCSAGCCGVVAWVLNSSMCPAGGSPVLEALHKVQDAIIPHVLLMQMPHCVRLVVYLCKELALQGSYSQVQAWAVQGGLLGAHPPPQVVQQSVCKPVHPQTQAYDAAFRWAGLAVQLRGLLIRS